MTTIAPKIIFEDACLVAFDKPAGLVVNRSDTHKGLTLQDVVEDQIDQEQDGDETAEDYTSRSGILHRLDKDTSGIILVAKDIESFRNIQHQFKERQVIKNYKAIVLGSLKDSRITVDAPIGRNPTFGFKFAIVSDGRASYTDIQLEKMLEISGRKYSAITAMPKTGRTHQIRVHCAALGHFIAGDPIYCTRKDYEVSTADFGRMMLHAYSIEFKHPKTNGKIILKSDLPTEFKPYLD